MEGLFFVFSKKIPTWLEYISIVSQTINLKKNRTEATISTSNKQKKKPKKFG